MHGRRCDLCDEIIENPSPSQKRCSKDHYRNCIDCSASFLLTTYRIRKNQLRCKICARKKASREHSEKMMKKFADGELVGFKDPVLQLKALEAIKKKYGVENISQHPDVRKKIIETFQEKYGADSPFEAVEIKEKIRKTNIERYGVGNVFEDPNIQKIIRDGFIDKYGVDQPMRVKEIHEKQIKTLKDNHGVESPLQNSEILARQISTLEEKYGVNNSSKIPHVKTAARENRLHVSDEIFIKIVKSFRETNNVNICIHELSQHFNYANYSPIYKRIRRLNLEEYIDYSYPLINQYWKALILETFGVDFQYEGKIFTDNKWRCDLFYEPLKLAIDINPTISHSTQKSHPLFEPKTTKYHQNRALDAEKNGWILYQIYDWNDEEQVLKQLKNLLQLNDKKVFARKCVVVRPSREKVVNFLNKTHLQGTGAIGNIFYGLEFNDELVQVMTFSKERFRGGSKDGYELIRLSSDGTVVGGASKLFKSFVKDFSPRRVKTFSSLDTGHGKVYETLGFRFDKIAALNAFYSKPGTREAFKVTTCTSKFKDIYSEMGLSQKEYMNSKGFYRINDAGNKVFVWEDE